MKFPTLRPWSSCGFGWSMCGRTPWADYALRLKKLFLDLQPDLITKEIKPFPGRITFAATKLYFFGEQSQWQWWPWRDQTEYLWQHLAIINAASNRARLDLMKAFQTYQRRLSKATPELEWSACWGKNDSHCLSCDQPGVRPSTDTSYRIVLLMSPNHTILCFRNELRRPNWDLWKNPFWICQPWRVNLRLTMQ